LAFERIGVIIVVMHWQTGMVETKGREMLLFYFSKILVEKKLLKTYIKPVST